MQLFSQIMLEKFKRKTAVEYFKESSKDRIQTCYRYFMKDEEATATYVDMLLETLIAIDAYFGANIFHFV